MSQNQTVIKIETTLYCDNKYTVDEAYDIIRYVNPYPKDSRIEWINEFNITCINNVKVGETYD